MAPGTDHSHATGCNEGAGMQFENITGYCFPFSAPGLVPLYRYFDPSAIDHFYTTNPLAELGAGGAGYRLEGIQCHVAP